MSLDNDTDEGFLTYVWLHSETERALLSREHVLRLLKLANVPEGQYGISMGRFIAVHYDVAKPLIERARRQLKRQTPQLELPFKGDRGAEDFLL
jgi:hypothetical protein